MVTALAGGTAFASVEPNVTAWDGIWWAVTTMTTVGYGDLSPATDAGRAIAIAVMLVGIGFLSMLIGAVADRFIDSDRSKLDAERDARLLAEIRRLGDRLADVERALHADARRGAGPPPA